MGALMYKKLFLDDSAQKLTTNDLERMKGEILGTIDFNGNSL